MSMVEYYPASTKIEIGDRVVYVPITEDDKIWLGTVIGKSTALDFFGSGINLNDVTIGIVIKFDDHERPLFYDANHVRKVRTPSPMDAAAKEYEEIIEFERAYNEQIS